MADLRLEAMPPSRILIVDDDSQFRRTLQLGLVAHGYEVSGAADGAEALNSIATEGPDLIVLDWSMPGMDGVEMCRMLRANSEVPVIMVSGNRSKKLRDAALEAGANDYLAKPFSIDELLTLLDCFLGPQSHKGKHNFFLTLL